MVRSRLLPVVCLLLGALALALPAAALAGGSAGNQQYTDPFSSTTTHSAPAPATTTPATTTPSSTGAAPDATPTAAPVPTATVATAPGVTTDAASGGTLPYSGYADWMAGGFGATLLGVGLLLRRRTREER